MADLTKDQMHEIARGIRYDITAIDVAIKLIQQRDVRSEALRFCHLHLLELVRCNECNSCGAEKCSEAGDHMTACPLVESIQRIEEALRG